MFYEFSFHEHIVTFLTLFIILARKGPFFIVIVAITLSVQLFIIWDFKSKIKEERGNCTRYKFNYIEKVIKIC